MKRSPLYMDECYNCPAIGICGGGCVINTESADGDIFTPDRRFCKQTLEILNYLIEQSVSA